jgi:aminopeptidase YwaD
VWAHLRALCIDIGPRLSGSPGDERAVEYIAAHFRRCGAQVEVQNFPCPSWDYESATLTVLQDGTSEDIPAVGQTFSLPCDLEAPLVRVRTWEELDLGPDLEGKVLLLEGEAAGGLALDRNRTLLAAEARQAAAIVAVSPLETVATKLIRDPFLSVPAVGVSRSAGARLAALAEQPGTRVRLQLRCRRYPSTGHNVIATLPGREPGRIVVAAHYDSAATVPGATDNASGTAAILELCEALVATRPRYTIDLVTFGADEYGRYGGNLGAAEYVRRHPHEVATARGVVEADGIGTAPRRPRLRLVGWPSPTRDRLLEVLHRFPAYEVNDQSDQPNARPVAFYLPRVPAVHLVDDYRFLPIHTPADTIDLMDPEALLLATQVMAAVVEELAQAGSSAD